MPTEIDVKINYGNFKKIIKALSQSYSLKVGLLAEKGSNEEVSKNLDLAGLGAVQEFGCTINVTDKMRGYFLYKWGIKLVKDTITIPARSFLQMPLERKNEVIKRLKNKTASPEEVMDYIVRTGDMRSVAELLGASAVEQIQEAFDTHGWGEWAENAPLTIMEKGSNMQLVDEGHLRQAITYKVEEK